MKNLLKSLSVLFVISIAALAANAQTNFNNSTGTGSVDSSTVAYSLGYTKRQMQNNKDNTTFSYVAIYTYQVFCNALNTSEQIDVTVQTEVNRILRTNRRGSFDGYTFTGFGNEMNREFTPPCGGSGDYSMNLLSSTRGFLHSHNNGVTGRLYY